MATNHRWRWSHADVAPGTYAVSITFPPVAAMNPTYAEKLRGLTLDETATRWLVLAPASLA